MPNASVLFQTDGPVCTILLNRPAAWLISRPAGNVRTTGLTG
ncbi:hypothetical protein [Ralstonia pseudosolanacearum]